MILAPAPPRIAAIGRAHPHRIATAARSDRAGRAGGAAPRRPAAGPGVTGGRFPSGRSPPACFGGTGDGRSGPARRGSPPAVGPVPTGRPRRVAN